MSINYTYEIINVNVEARCMEIVYSADGYPTQHVSTRIPYEGESLETVVRTMSPVTYWNELQRNIVPPSVGYSGEIKEADEAAEIAAAVAAQLALEAQPQPVTTGSQDL